METRRHRELSELREKSNGHHEKYEQSVGPGIFLLVGKGKRPEEHRMPGDSHRERMAGRRPGQAGGAAVDGQRCPVYLRGGSGHGHMEAGLPDRRRIQNDPEGPRENGAIHGRRIQKCSSHRKPHRLPPGSGEGDAFPWSQWYRVERKRRTGTDIYLLLFERFARYRAWEWLTKMGLGHLLLRYAEGEAGIWSLFNWRGKTVDDIFRCHLTKDDKAVLRETPVTEDLLEAWRQWKSCQPSALLRDVLACWPRYWGSRQLEKDAVREIMKRITPAQWLRYEQAGRNDVREFSDYVDYIEQCGKLGIELDDKSALWPKHFQDAHWKNSRKLQLMEDKWMQNQYEGRKEELKRKYEYEDSGKGLRVVVPEKLEELIEEGERQHNCVGGYMRRVADGETDVVFIRKTEWPGESYITVEVHPETGRILQARVKYNRSVQDAGDRAFLREWERYVRAGI